MRQGCPGFHLTARQGRVPDRPGLVAERRDFHGVELERGRVCRRWRPSCANLGVALRCLDLRGEMTSWCMPTWASCCRFHVAIRWRCPDREGVLGPAGGESIGFASLRPQLGVFTGEWPLWRG